MILLDVGVWLAAIWGRHAHHPATADWFGRQTGDLAFCRITQMSLLRLLSNPAIMGGDAVDRSQAWRTFDQLWADERVLWADKPDELDAVWRAAGVSTDAGALTTVIQPLPIAVNPWLAAGLPGAWGDLPCRTVAPGGGVKVSSLGGGAVNWICVYPTWIAGDVAPRAKTSTRNGTPLAASTAIRTWPISDRWSFGASTSS